jgi:hypothetical protein
MFTTLSNQLNEESPDVSNLLKVLSFLHYVSVFSDELVLRSRIINVGERWADVFGKFDCRVDQDVAADDGEVGEEFWNLRIGKNEREDGAKMLDGCRWGVSKYSLENTK